MSGATTIAITVGVAVAVLVGFFIVYYLGNVANSIYDIKVGVRKDFDKKVKELQDAVEKEMKQRITWMREENKEETKRLKTTIEDSNQETIGELGKTIERLRQDITSLQVQLGKLAEGKALDLNEAPKKPVPRVGAGNVGDLEVARVGLPDSEPAPDMAMKATGIKPHTVPDPLAGEEAQAGDQPSFKPQQPKSVLAGKASVEEKAKKKKRRDPDEFEAFTQFKGGD
jgi:gas vesicle protein